jgi:hypothetical protein
MQLFVVAKGIIYRSEVYLFIRFVCIEIKVTITQKSAGA